MARGEDILWYDLDRIQEAVIYPLADVHCGAEGADMEAFTALVKQIATEPNSYVTLQGDLIDNGTKNSVTNVYRATMRPAEQKREMSRVLEPIRDKILCIIPGNHERRTSRETDDDPCYDIASKLDIEHKYRESIAFIRIRIGWNSRSTKPFSYYLACLHGAGGGALPGAGINRGDNYMQSMDGVDVLITGHTHRPYCLRGSKIVIDQNNLIATQRPTLSMCAGSWLGYVGYPIDKMLRPVALPGANKLLLRGDRFRFEAVV